MERVGQPIYLHTRILFQFPIQQTSYVLFQLEVSSMSLTKYYHSLHQREELCVHLRKTKPFIVPSHKTLQKTNLETLDVLGSQAYTYQDRFSIYCCARCSQQRTLASLIGSILFSPCFHDKKKNLFRTVIPLPPKHTNCVVWKIHDRLLPKRSNLTRTTIASKFKKHNHPTF